jgi:hypothetical protein
MPRWARPKSGLRSRGDIVVDKTRHMLSTLPRQRAVQPKAAIRKRIAVYRDVVSFLDVLPTSVVAAGGKLPTD